MAREQDANFREVVLIDEKASALARFGTRRDDSPWGQHNRHAAAAQGGPAFLADMYDRLLEVVPLRTKAVVVRAEPWLVEVTYTLVIEALARLQAEKP